MAVATATAAATGGSKVGIRLAKILLGVCKMASNMNMADRAKQMITIPPLKTALLNQLQQSQQQGGTHSHYDREEKDADSKLLVKLCRQLLEVAEQLR